MFWNCIHARTLWTELNTWLSSKLNLNIVDLQESALMNIFDVDIVFEDLLILLCFVYTICKRIIYQNRQNSIPVSLYNLINVLKKYEYVERLIAIKNKQLQKHFNKWLDLFVIWLNEAQWFYFVGLFIYLFIYCSIVYILSPRSWIMNFDSIFEPLALKPTEPMVFFWFDLKLWTTVLCLSYTLFLSSWLMYVL